MNKRLVVQLVSENLTGLGGPMGSDRTSTNWRKLFSTEDAARAWAEGDYGHGSIAWVTTPSGTRSPDLGHVMYHIKTVEVEA